MQKKSFGFYAYWFTCLSWSLELFILLWISTQYWWMITVSHTIQNHEWHDSCMRLNKSNLNPESHVVYVFINLSNGSDWGCDEGLVRPSPHSALCLQVITTVSLLLNIHSPQSSANTGACWQQALNQGIPPETSWVPPSVCVCLQWQWGFVVCWPPPLKS